MAIMTGCGSQTVNETVSETETETVNETVNETETVVEVNEPVEEEAVEIAEPDLPEGNYQEMGEGTVYIATAGGTSEDGNIPVLYASEDSLIQIGLNAEDFNGGALSYIYVDGYLLTKEQLANTQTSLELTGSNLAAGVHKVEIVQYENDDPTGAMITYRLAEYEVKPE
jgi:hypothetical protein